MPAYEYRGSTKNEPTIIRGRVLGKNGQPLALCGGRSGYLRHLRNNETPCDDCKDGNARQKAAQRGGTHTGQRTGPAQCGTHSGAIKHRTKGEPTCFACRIAESAYRRELYARKKATA